MSKDIDKSELLKDKVVDLVKGFIKIEGGITPNDLEALFGPISCKHYEVAAALAMQPISLD